MKIWCLGGPLHGEEMPDPNRGEFDVRNESGESVHYSQQLLQVDGLERLVCVVGPTRSLRQSRW